MADNEIPLKPLDNLFGNPQDTGERVENIRLDILHDFPKHPFRVEVNEDLQAMADDIKENGVRQPIIARAREDGGYEIISGHRRRKACELAGITEIPTIVKKLTDDEAIIIMCSTNFHQRKTLLPSEKAFAYKMQLEAMKRQGKRTDLTSCQVGEKLSVTELAENSNDSERQIHRYIRLTYLIPPLLELVDNKQLHFNPAVSLSYLKPEIEQQLILEQIEMGNIPIVAQATPTPDKKDIETVVWSVGNVSEYDGLAKTPELYNTDGLIANIDYISEYSNNVSGQGEIKITSLNDNYLFYFYTYLITLIVLITYNKNR